jgi:hypothetical protein
MRKKIVLIALLILFLSGAGGLYYVNNHVLPVLVKEKIIAGLEDLTSGKVSVEKINFSLWRGIVLSGLTIFEKNDPQNELLSVKEASATFLILPFFKQNQVILPSVKIKSALFRLSRLKDRTFNIAYLIDRIKQGSTAGKTPAVLIRSIDASDSSVLFTDAALQAPVSITLKVNRLVTKMSWFRALIEAALTVSKDAKETPVRVSGVYSFKNQQWRGAFRLTALDLKNYQAYLTNLPFTFDSGEIPELKGTLTEDNEKIKSDVTAAVEHLDLTKEATQLKNADLDVDITLQVPKNNLAKINYQGRLKMNSAGLVIKNPWAARGKVDPSLIEFSGDRNVLRLNLDLNISGVEAAKEKIVIANAGGSAQINMAIPLSNQENLVPSYEGTIYIKNADIAGIETIDKISAITAKLKIKNSDVLIQEATAKILDEPVSATGFIRNNVFALDASGAFPLEKLLPILSKQITLPGLQFTGNTALKIHAASDPAKSSALSFSGEALLSNISFELPENGLAFNTNNGHLKFDTSEEKLEYHFDAIEYEKRSYSLDGTWKGFKTPLIRALVVGPNIRVQTDMTRQNDRWDFSSLKGVFEDLNFDLSGSIDKKQRMNFSGTLGIDLKNLKIFFPKYAKQLEGAGMEGLCSFVAEVSGPMKNYELWKIKAKGKSRLIRLSGLKFTDVELDYTQIEQEGFLNTLSFGAYQGRGAIKGKFDITKNNISYALRGILQDVDLNRLKLDTPLSDKTFSGTLGMNISVSGQSNNLNSIKGGGALLIRDGNLWEFNPLKKLGNFLFVPRFDTISFTSAQGDFFIADQCVSTDNLELLGPGLGLIAEGKITFGGELDFLVNTQILPTGPAGKVDETISKAASLTAIKITGTVREPKYKLQAIGENIMKKLGDILSGIAP